jgi:hypothetical protein
LYALIAHVTAKPGRARDNLIYDQQTLNVEHLVPSVISFSLHPSRFPSATSYAPTSTTSLDRFTDSHGPSRMPPNDEQGKGALGNDEQGKGAL